MKRRRQRAASPEATAADASAAPRRKLRWRVLQRVVLHGLLFFTVLLLGARALLSGLAGSQAEVALWLSETLGLPVRVERVAGAWAGWSPAVAAEGVHLGDPRGGIGIQRIAVAVDPGASLARGELVPSRVSVGGLDLILEEREDGSLRVQGLDAGSGAPPSSDGMPLLAALGRVQRLDLSADRLVLRSHRLPHELVLAPVSLSARGAGEDRALHLEARLAASGGGLLRVRIAWPQPGPQPPPLTWYAEVEGLELARLRDWLPELPEGLAGEVSLQSWSAPGAGGPAGRTTAPAEAGSPPRIALAPPARFQLQAEGVALGDPLFDELQLAGMLAPATAGEGQTLRLRIEEARSPRGRWPDAELCLALDGPAGQPGGLRLAMRFLRIDDLSPLLAHLAQADGLRLRGDLSDLRLRWRPDARGLLEGLELRTAFSGLGAELAAGAVEAERSEGRVALEGGRALVSLEAAGLRLGATATVGIDSIERAEGAVALRLEADGPHIHIHRLLLEHPALALGLDGRLDPSLVPPVSPVPPGGPSRRGDAPDASRGTAATDTSTDSAATDGAPPAAAAHTASADTAAFPDLDADLTLRVFRGDLARLHELLPALPALDAARKWMQERLLAGGIVQGSGVFRGPIRAWPWRQAEGHSELALSLADARIRFNPDWPVAEGVRADLVLRGTRLEIRGHEARLLDVKMLEGTGSLPDILGPEPRLALELLLQASGAASKQLLNESPMRNGPGRRLAKVNVSGLIDYRLGLDIPLYPGPVTAIDAEARFTGNDLDFGGELGLTDIEGSLPFTRDKWGGGTAAKARYEGLPVTVSAGSIPDADGGGSRIALSGRAGRDFLAAQIAQHAEAVHEFMQQRAMWPLVTGEAAFDAEIRIPPREAPEGAETTLSIQSNLDGLGLALPAPLGKPEAGESALRLLTGLDAEPDERIIELRIGEAHSRIRLRRQEPEGKRLFAGAGLRLGEGVTELPAGPVLALRGAMERLSITEWERLLTVEGAPPEENPLDLDFDLRTLELLALGQRFDDMRLIGRRDNGGWSLAVASEDADGRINWPRGAGTATFQFTRLTLDPDPHAPPAEATSPAELPSIVGAVGEFSYAGNQLGRMRLSTAPLADGSGLELKELQFDSERFRVDATGQWLARGLSQRSVFRIELEAPDIAQLLSSFGYTTEAIEGARTRMVIDARWPGAPEAFRLDALSGELEMHLGKGRLLDVDPSAGRLFGLLSLQTLPRRLSLDFGDIFEEGFAFDRIDGTFRLDAGNAYTDDLTMVGPAGKVLVSGRTGLAARDYDQRVKVEPALSSSLPVAGALFGPVGIGVGAALYLGQKVFRAIPRAIDSVIAQYYSVTGPWTEPVIEKQSAAERKADSG